MTEPVEIVDRDHFSEIRARFGVEIPTIPATQAPLNTGNQRLEARTDVVGPTGTPRGSRLFEACQSSSGPVRSLRAVLLS